MKTLHDFSADPAGGNLFFAAFLKLTLNFVHHLFDGFGGNRPLLARLLQAVDDFQPVERLASAVFFGDHRKNFFNPFVGSVALLAGFTLAASTDDIAFARFAGIDDFTFGVTAEGTFQRIKVTS